MNKPLNRRPKTSRLVAAACCLIPILGLAACGGGGGGGNEPGSVELNLVVGNLLPLDGPSRALGESGRKASDLAIEQLEEAIGETGSDHTVRAVSRDQGIDVSASGAAKGLVDEAGSSCLTGPWSADAVAQTGRDVAIPSEVLEIAPVPTGEAVSGLNDHDLVNSTALPESVEGSALSQAIERDLGGAEGRTVNVAASDNSYGDSLTQDFVEDWQDDDGTVAAQTVLTSPPLSSSSGSQITSGGPDAILLIADLNAFSQLAATLSASAGWNPATAWGSDQLVSPGLPSLVGAEAIDGMRVLAPGAPSEEPVSSAFAQSFKAGDPRAVKPAPFAAQEFDATVLCYLAAVAAGSTDGQKMADELIDITAPGGDQFSWQQLPDAIKALEDGQDIDYVGASGPIDMDVGGNPTSGVFDVYRYSGRRLSIVDEVSVEKPNPAAP
ncbi:MAG TPA: ABC transporter substrate-binding protein [Solirubrobacterales bacterium]|nr:ABC transporter substrate-binding protein [Solirubrobacterales bacterium]